MLESYKLGDRNQYNFIVCANPNISYVHITSQPGFSQGLSGLENAAHKRAIGDLATLSITGSGNARVGDLKVSGEMQEVLKITDHLLQAGYVLGLWDAQDVTDAKHVFNLQENEPTASKTSAPNFRQWNNQWINQHSIKSALNLSTSDMVRLRSAACPDDIAIFKYDLERGENGVSCLPTAANSDLFGQYVADSKNWQNEKSAGASR